MRKAEVFKERAMLTTATIDNFEGSVQEWKDAFYEIWRYQMYWQFAYEISLIENIETVFLRVVSKPEYQQSFEELLKRLGYRNVETDECLVGEIDAYDLGGELDESVFELEHIGITW